MFSVSLDRFSTGRRDSQDYSCLPTCENCGHELHGGQFFDDCCNECAVIEGWLEVDEG
jgi:hypothetical protein